MYHRREAESRRVLHQRRDLIASILGLGNDDTSTAATSTQTTAAAQDTSTATSVDATTTATTATTAAATTTSSGSTDGSQTTSTASSVTTADTSTSAGTTEPSSSEDTSTSVASATGSISSVIAASSTESSITSTSSEVATTTSSSSSETDQLEASTAVITTQGSTVTEIISYTSTASSASASGSGTATVASGASSSSSFLDNKTLSGFVFALCGIVGVVIVFMITMFIVRRRRHRRLNEAAISFDPTSLVARDDFDDHGSLSEKELTRTISVGRSGFAAESSSSLPSPMPSAQPNLMAQRYYDSPIMQQQQQQPFGHNYNGSDYSQHNWDPAYTQNTELTYGGYSPYAAPTYAPQYNTMVAPQHSGGSGYHAPGVQVPPQSSSPPRAVSPQRTGSPTNRVPSPSRTGSPPQAVTMDRVSSAPRTPENAQSQDSMYRLHPPTLPAIPDIFGSPGDGGAGYDYLTGKGTLTVANR